ncbi:MAG: methylmalonyl-CoA mutase, partial [Acidobacteria bacterium]|nr:methylmalonyl-CoA mutase [Acidobacteriota bacterium]
MTTKAKERKERFTTTSDIELPNRLTPQDVPVNYADDLGEPGAFPFTRGVYETMYRGR